MDTPKTTSSPIGPEISTARALLPPHTLLEGRFITLAPLLPDHANDLFTATCGPSNAALWIYLPSGPFPTLPSFHAHITAQSRSIDPLFYALLHPTTHRPLGLLALLHITPAHRTVEVGYILFSPELQRTRAATEAHYLLARHVFEDLGYRRYEWKCDDLNGPSKRAAARLGFVWEGVFRQHLVVKGRNRDTAWFSMLDREWEGVRRGLEMWLEEGNFDEGGRQRRGLVEIRGRDELEEAEPEEESDRETRGLFKLDGTPEDKEYNIDIVAVHGLGGDWEKTWTDPSGKLWLRDFLPAEIPSARLFSYGYNSRTAFSKAVTNITDEATMLLNRLDRERQGVAKTRPIIFIRTVWGASLSRRYVI
ncbi:hypothetical protein MMC08_005766 [Hypocenomyce scalaris]|nr:hypothetical protein [Hypocenomyce scalaris]